MSNRFRKKTIVIEAMQWDGQNADAVVRWAQGDWNVPPPFAPNGDSIWIKQKVLDPDADPVKCLWYLVIPTLEGNQEVSPGDWIIRGIAGELYLCKPDIFAATYESEAGA